MGLFDMFKKPEWKNKDPKIRIEAIKDLNDEKVLMDIVKNDSDNDVREVAINKITDNSFLVDIAKNSDYSPLRRYAFANINYESKVKILNEINNKEELLHILEYYIDDEKVLSNYQNEIYNEIIRQYERSISGTSYTLFDPGFSYTLFDKIIDQELLYKLVLRCAGAGPKSAKYITNRACENITDEKILERIAFNFRSGQLIVDSFGQSNNTQHVMLFNPVKKIEDKSILTNIANNCDDHEFREYARNKLKD